MDKAWDYKMSYLKGEVTFSFSDFNLRIKVYIIFVQFDIFIVL